MRRDRCAAFQPNLADQDVRLKRLSDRLAADTQERGSADKGDDESNERCVQESLQADQQLSYAASKRSLPRLGIATRGMLQPGGG